VAYKPEVHNGQLINSLSVALRYGSSSLSDIPQLVKRILQDEMWRSFVIEPTGQHAENRTFAEFVTRKPLDGLGSDVKTIQRMCADDTETLDLIDRASKEEAKHGGDRKSVGVKGMNHSLDATIRDRSSQHLRRLRKDFPDLHKRVLKNELSVSQAAIEAGIYPKRISISVVSPKSAAGTIINAVDDDYIHRLIEELQARR
jgi:hypothetical protein